MGIQGIGSGLIHQPEKIDFQEEKKQQRQDQQTSLPSSWGRDRVSFSAEAKASAQNSPPTEMSAGDEFASYMKSKRSRAQSGSPEERIKQLEAQLKSLEGQLSQVASENGADKTSRVESIQSQIDSVLQQIAELSGQLGKGQGEDTQG